MIAILFIVTAVLSYLVGSLNNSIIISNLLIKNDVRNSGSGNAGATNMVRTYGKKYGVLTFFLDFMKVVLAYFIVYFIFKSFLPDILLTYGYFVKVVSAFFCFLGHIFPCFFGFKGGKGITVCAGMICIIDWRMFIFGATLFFVVMFITKYTSLSSIIFAVTYPVFTLFLFDTSPYGENGTKFKILAVLIATLFSIIVIFKHKENIKRLLNGTENKIGSKKKEKEEQEKEIIKNA